MNSPDELALLIKDAKRLDPAAFDRLVDLYSSRLYGFMYRFTGRRDDAEDLVQDVFLRVVRSIGAYNHDGRFESWLFRIAANLLRDYLRTVNRTPSAAALDGVPDADSRQHLAGCVDDPDAQATQREQWDRLQSALSSLSEAQREVILLRHYSGMSFGEIAELTGVPVGTALARAHRGLEKLRQLFEAQN